MAKSRTAQLSQGEQLGEQGPPGRGRASGKLPGAAPNRVVFPFLFMVVASRYLSMTYRTRHPS